MSELFRALLTSDHYLYDSRVAVKYSVYQFPDMSSERDLYLLSERILNQCIKASNLNIIEAGQAAYIDVFQRLGPGWSLMDNNFMNPDLFAKIILDERWNLVEIW